MTHKIVGKAVTTETWLRLDEPEYCQRPMIDDIIETDDAVYRVGGGYGYRPMHLYWIDQDADNDEPADLAAERDYRQTVDAVARENA